MISTSFVHTLPPSVTANSPAFKQYSPLTANLLLPPIFKNNHTMSSPDSQILNITNAIATVSATSVAWQEIVPENRHRLNHKKRPRHFPPGFLFVASSICSTTTSCLRHFMSGQKRSNSHHSFDSSGSTSLRNLKARCATPRTLHTVSKATKRRRPIVSHPCPLSEHRHHRGSLSMRITLSTKLKH